MEKKITFALCGCGHIAPRWLDVFSENEEAELIAVADPDNQAFEKLDKYNFKDLIKYSTIEQALDEQKPDALVIATPPQLHAKYILEAISRDIHVLVEKPMCVTIEELKNIYSAIQKAEKNKVITAVNQQYRWNPRIQAIKKAVDDNLLGDIFLINSKFSQNNYNFNTWWRRELEYISLFNWYVHHIDTMRYYISQKPIKVWAKFIRPPHSRIAGYSSMILNVTFEKGVEWNFTASQESVAGYTDSGHTTFSMYGTKGTLLNTKNDAPFLYSFDGTEKELGENIANLDNESKYPPGWGDSVDRFIYSIHNNIEHPTSMKDNIWTMSILFAAIKSFESKKIVSINEILENISFNYQ
ncbi:MAG: Gfo/Idh/MocA family oxidoreductase [archaeon]|nr:Gfo/Idh/MocA family oxidoreductase [archaeon]